MSVSQSQLPPPLTPLPAPSRTAAPPGKPAQPTFAELWLSILLLFVYCEWLLARPPLSSQQHHGLCVEWLQLLSLFGLFHCVKIAVCCCNLPFNGCIVCPRLVVTATVFPPFCSPRFVTFRAVGDISRIQLIKSCVNLFQYKYICIHIYMHICIHNLGVT